MILIEGNAFSNTKKTNKHLLPAKAQKQYWPISKEYAANNLYIYI